MAYQDTVKVGDIITIGNSTVDLLVVKSELYVEHDQTRGDSYSVDEIEVITLVEAKYDDPPVSHYYFDHGSMRGHGTMIRAKDVKVVGKCQVEKVVTINYHVSKPQFF